MEITGKLLYELFVEGQILLNNCRVDSWDELEEAEQAVWDYIAEKTGEL